MIKIEDYTAAQEKVNGWLIILSILVPIAGLIIFFKLKDEKPKTAKISGICALISFVLIITLIIIFPIVSSVKVANDIIENSSDAMKENIFLSAEDTIILNLAEAKDNYYAEKNLGNDNIKLSEYIKKALEKSQTELKEEGISLTGSGRTLYLSYDKYKVKGTLTDECIVIWSKVEK